MNLISPGRNLVLIGLMGSGKTTVGRHLATRLGRDFVDTDQVVEERTGLSVTELFGDSERTFRAEEAAAIRHVSALRGQVIAVGGGAVLDPMNVTHLRSTGDLILLDAMAAVLANRVGDTSSRPLLAAFDDTTARLAQLQDERADAYRTAASYVVDTNGKAPDEVATEILAWAETRFGLINRDEVGR